MPRGKQLSQDRREAILLAALECFNAVGIEATAIGDIGKRAGASVGSMYHHFGNKEGIAIALMVEGLRRNAEHLAERLSDASGPREGVAMLIESLVDWVCDHPDWARFIYTVSSSRLMQQAQVQLAEVNARQANLLEAYFAPYIQSGELRDLPQEVLPALVLGPVHDYARRWLNGQVVSSPKCYRELLVQSAWQMVMA